MSSTPPRSLPEHFRIFFKFRQHVKRFEIQGDVSLNHLIAVCKERFEVIRMSGALREFNCPLQGYISFPTGAFRLVVADQVTRDVFMDVDSKADLYPGCVVHVGH